MNIDENFFGNINLEEDVASEPVKQNKIVPTPSQIILEESAETPEDESIFNKSDEEIYVVKKKDSENEDFDILQEKNVKENDTIHQPAYSSLTKTIIADDCQITGEVKSKSDIELYGQIKGGDIKTAGNIHLGSTGFSEKGLFSKADIFIENRKQDDTKYINGPIVGENIKIDGGFIKGTVDAKQLLELNEDCVIVGDIKCKSAIIKGAVQGNITAIGNVDLSSSAIVKGSVTASTINISEGAALDGTFTLTTKKDIDYDKIFK